MLYTIKDVREKLAEMSSPYAKVEVDGEIKGIAYMNDLREWAFYWSKNGRRKIRKVFLSGKTYDVQIGINLYPTTQEELWTHADRQIDKLAKCGERISENRENDKANISEPLVHWDAKTGIIKIREDKDKGGNKSVKTKDRKKYGLLERIKRWLKGDVGFRR